MGAIATRSRWHRPCRQQAGDRLHRARRWISAGQSIDEVMAKQELAELGETVRIGLAEESGGRIFRGSRSRCRRRAPWCAFSNQALTGEGRRNVIGPGHSLQGDFPRAAYAILRRIVGRSLRRPGARCAQEFETALTALGRPGRTNLERRLHSSRPTCLNSSSGFLVHATAIGNWLDVDDALAESEYPRCAAAARSSERGLASLAKRPESPPARVVELTRAVEDYYETGENTRARIL